MAIVPTLQIPHSSTCYSHTFLCLTQPVSLSELKLIQRRDDSRQTLDPLARCHTKEMLVKIKRGRTNQREIFLLDSVFDYGRVRSSKTQKNVIAAGSGMVCSSFWEEVGLSTGIQ